jgi:glycosyltransferase involved in cell wall biosynthesis
VEEVKSRKVAVVCVASASGEMGGMERHYDGLVSALRSSGERIDAVKVTSDESDFAAVQETYLRFYDLDLSAYDGIITIKGPSYVVRHPNQVCWLNHTMRVFYDMFEREFPHAWPELEAQRALIQRLDTAALSRPSVRRFVVGQEVADRLRRFNGLDAEVLYPGLGLEGFRSGAYEHLFLPGRLHRWKRVDLVIEAMRFVERPVKFLIAGTGEDEEALRLKAVGDPRIQFLGRITDQQLIELYAGAIAVPFVPIHEDYGMVTIEAFRSRKPVITCDDSGEPAHMVRDGETGFVCPPEPKALAQKITWLYDHPKEAAQMGAKGEASVRHIRWDVVVDRLLGALFPKRD